VCSVARALQISEANYSSIGPLPFGGRVRKVAKHIVEVLAYIYVCVSWGVVIVREKAGD